MAIHRALFLLLVTCCIGEALSQHCSAAYPAAPFQIRKEWGEMTAKGRTKYIKAVLCMKKKPPLLLSLGVRSRYDDFTATHINYSLSIHASGPFLPWHRHFVWVWEKALREECGYRGSQPYWNWALWPKLAASPLFDGSSTSLSGDGQFDPNTAKRDIPSANDTGQGLPVPPPGTEGGCVKSGPFAHWTIGYGPFTTDIFNLGAELPPDAFAYNPRCLTRNLNSQLVQNFNNHAVIDRLLSARDIIEFQQLMHNFPDGSAGVIGPHAAAHRAPGPDMFDFFASPQDPAFMLHHGMVDRVWMMWQNRDIRSRRYALNGSSSIFYRRTTPPVTLDTVLEFGILDRPQTLRELMRPGKYNYCYT